MANRTHEQVQHDIDCAYDCDCPDLVPALEAELKALGPWPALVGCDTQEDPYADTAKLFGVAEEVSRG